MNTIEYRKAVSAMPFVRDCDQTLDNLGHWWQKVSLIGKIVSLDIAATLLDDMDSTRNHFKKLQKELVTQLARENLSKIEVEMGSRAQFVIDILVRNLFERTADVGFLATDDAIRNFLKTGMPEENDSIVQRLREYVLKYSVYDEILLITPQGAIQAHLDTSHSLTHSNDPLIQETLHSSAPYLETFRATDLHASAQPCLMYSAKIQASSHNQASILGVLCLCFRFQNEMDGIFQSLCRPHEILAILDEDQTVIASSDPQALPLNTRIPRHITQGLLHIKIQQTTYLAAAAQAKGYQGYSGPPWTGLAMIATNHAFASQKTSSQDAIADMDFHAQHDFFSQALRTIHHNAAWVTDDLSLIVLNGQIVAARREATELMPVLNEIRTIGQQTQAVFERSITYLYRTVFESLLYSIQFQAFLAVNIMDRNLYERANDVRWWALTDRFREILAQPDQSAEDIETLTEILHYINDLYTVYTHLFIFSKQRVVLAVSQPDAQHWLGTTLPGDGGFQAALEIADSQRYTVTPFQPTPLYNQRPTYIYLTGIRAPTQQRVVGGIGIVFDSEPQFQAMLHDALPRDEHQQVLSGAFAVFTDRAKTIISATHPTLVPGQPLALTEDVPFTLKKGERRSMRVCFEQREYVLGVAVSNGYREYKTTKDYENDVIALIFMPLS